MNALINTTANITHYAADQNPFVAFAADVNPSYVVGKTLRYKKGDFVLGGKNDEEGVPLGSHMLVVMSLLMHGWRKFENSKPIDSRYARIAWGEKAPERRSLGDLDETAWELFNGERKDPWSESMLLPMLRPADGTACTFQTGSWGGKKAITELSLAYGKARGKGQTDFPLIELQSRTRQAKHGPVKEPRFVIIGSEPVALHRAALGEAGVLEWLAEEPPPLPPAGDDFAANARPRQAMAVEMDDEIPF